VLRVLSSLLMFLEAIKPSCPDFDAQFVSKFALQAFIKAAAYPVQMIDGPDTPSLSRKTDWVVSSVMV
jgi:hypothetical protein